MDITTVITILNEEKQILFWYIFCWKVPIIAVVVMVQINIKRGYEHFPIWKLVYLHFSVHSGWTPQGCNIEAFDPEFF